MEDETRRVAGCPGGNPSGSGNNGDVGGSTKREGKSHRVHELRSARHAEEMRENGGRIDNIEDETCGIAGCPGRNGGGNENRIRKRGEVQSSAKRNTGSGAGFKP